MGERRRIQKHSELWWRLYDKADGVCLYSENSRYCEGELFEDGSNCEIDHRNPRILGGSNNIRNLQMICTTCNKRKAGKTHRKFLEYLESDYEEEDDGIFGW